MRKLLFVLLIILTSNTFAQQNKYPYEYRLNIPDDPSFYYISYDTVKNSPIDTSYYLLDLNIINKNGEPNFANIKLTYDSGDTLELAADYFTGIIKRKIQFDNFRLKTISFSGADIDFYVSAYGKSKITIVLGYSYKLFIPIIKSKRPLTDKEIIKLTYDIKNETIKDSKLIKNKTCYYFQEI